MVHSHSSLNIVSACRMADVSIILDASGSINHNNPYNWERMINFTVGFIDYFPISETNTHIALVRFSDEAYVEFHLNEFDNKRDVIEKVRTLRPIGTDTNIYGALKKTEREVYTRDNGDRTGKSRNLVILVTDGQETMYTPSEVNMAAADLKNKAEAEIFTVGVGDDVDQDQLRRIASDNPGRDHTFHVDDFDELMSILNKVMEEACPNENSKFNIEKKCIDLPTITST